MKILDNAIDSIVLGLQDYKSDDPRRLLSCTRNMFSGILLLFKCKLSLLSPEGTDESLIKQKVLPTKEAAGNINWEGKGKKLLMYNKFPKGLNLLRLMLTGKESLQSINSVMILSITTAICQTMPFNH